jgi:hypothetical protein
MTFARYTASGFEIAPLRYLGPEIAANRLTASDLLQDFREHFASAHCSAEQRQVLENTDFAYDPFVHVTTFPFAGLIRCKRCSFARHAELGVIIEVECLVSDALESMYAREQQEEERLEVEASEPPFEEAKHETSANSHPSEAAELWRDADEEKSESSQQSLPNPPPLVRQNAYIDDYATDNVSSEEDEESDA